MDGVQPPDLLAIAVGNTRTRCGVFIAGQLEASATAPNAHAGEIEDAIAAATGKHAETLALAAVSSVAHAHLETAIAAMRRVVPALEPQIAGRDIPLPIPLALEDPGTVGVDRLLNTTAAYETAKQACVVVDVGTAATVDFVDGQGVFQGGAIAPGLAMMLAALHEHTAALPQTDWERPDPQRGPFGKDTAHAMRLGAQAAIAGLVRDRLDAYAEAYGAYPQVIATGGDAAILEPTGLVDHFVPELQLMGLRDCVRSALEHDPTEDPLG